MNDKLSNFIQTNSPDGGFLQSDYWRKFQESVGRKTHTVSVDESGEAIANANVVMHTLPVVGKYFYVPRGPVVSDQQTVISEQYLGKNLKDFLKSLIDLAKKNNIGWIRIEPNSKAVLNIIRENLPEGMKIVKSSVDMQPREILVLDISRSEEKILAEMKHKTRYNIRLAEKKSVRVFASREEKHIENFLRLVKITSQRDKITSHPESYYRKMFEIIPPEILKLYIAEYEGKVICANLVLFYGETATYMHGASDNRHRNVMAPYLLQWRQIMDARNAGCEKYDFGGIKTSDGDNAWSGITKFKQGFAPYAEPIQFPGCYDIIVKFWKYKLYRILQKVKNGLTHEKK